MKFSKFVVYGSFLLTLVSVGVAAYLLKNEKKIAFVDAVRLFNSYEMKKEIEKQDGLKLDYMRQKIDSLKSSYEVAQKQEKPDNAIINQLGSELQHWNGLFEQEYAQSNRDINEKVWKRLNPLIDEFARGEHLDMLVGANGMGTVLYGSSRSDHTEKLIKFVNEKYASGQ